MKKIIKFFIGCLAATLLESCATSLKTTVLRPAELNMNGAKTISVLPFQRDFESYEKLFVKNNNGGGNGGNIANGNGNMQQNVQQTVTIVLGPQQSNERKETPEDRTRREIAEYFTNSLDSSLGGSQYLDLVSARAVQDAIQNSKENPADVYLAGYISNYKEAFSDRRSERTDKETGEKIVKIYYKRTVDLTITYEIVDSATNLVLATRRENISESSSEYENSNEVPDAMSIVKRGWGLGRLVDTIMKQVQPYPVTKSLALDKPKDKTQAKDPEFEAAYNAAKKNVLDVALEGFMSVYKEKNIVEAGYNAALIMEIFGDYQAAESLMNEVFKKSQSSKAAAALADIRNEIRSQQKVEAQLGQQRN